MSVIGDILNYRSLSIVGMAKNTGKTETLNYILRNLPPDQIVALTSIGTDGETTDTVTHTPKPEIEIRAGTIFGTGEKYYSGRRIVSEILDISRTSTIAGRIVTSRALTPGKAIISGPCTTLELARWREKAVAYGAGLVIFDGALSRMSGASPTVSESMILTTGAAFSADMEVIAKQTSHLVSMMRLPAVDDETRSKFCDLERGIWSMDAEGNPVKVGLPLGKEMMVEDIYVSGALTESILNSLRVSSRSEGIRLIVDDFTKIFLSTKSLGAFVRTGGRVAVMNKSELIAVTVNPVSPYGVRLDSERLIDRLSQSVDVPVYDIMKCG